MICQILGVFRNTLTTIDKYPFRDLENFLSPTQLQLSLKRKTSSDFLNPLMESTSNFKDFEKKDGLHSYFITKVTGFERLA